MNNIKKKMIVWGTAGKATTFFNSPYLYRGYKIVAFTDNNINKEEFHGINIININDIPLYNPDKIVICSSAHKEIEEQIKQMEFCEFPEVISYDDIMKLYKSQLKEKLRGNYSNSNDAEIIHFINYYKDKELGVYDDNIGPHTKDYVQYDDDNHPYILFFGKKMYYPDDYYFQSDNKGQYVPDILKEQGENSPHLYLTGTHTIHDGDVIVDAGVCEGNFSLRYIDKVKRAYLIESDPRWVRALKRTFAPYKEKVILCNNFLSRDTTSDTISLDDLIPEENINFIKMDIEGAEVDALLGAKRTLRRSNAKLSICSYHKHSDYENIKFILESLGYKTSSSRGYMCFIYDNKIIEHGDLRRGIVYGSKDRKL